MDRQSGPILIVFGNLVGFREDGTPLHTTAPALLDDLVVHRRVWYSANDGRATAGDRILFYQKMSGVCCAAEIRNVQRVSILDAALLRSIGATYYRFRYELGDVATFDSVDLRPLVGDLDFISNKARWGTSLRTTPRRIPWRDAGTILRGVNGLERVLPEIAN